MLEKLKSYAESGLKVDVHEAVVTHPAYFDQGQKQETIEAAYQAGFKRVYPISEPVRLFYILAHVFTYMNKLSSSRKILRDTLILLHF